MSDADQVARFLANACPDHHVRGGPAHAVARDTAARMLSKDPSLPRASLATAIVCGEVAEVKRLLAERPAAAKESLGPHGSAEAQGGSFIQVAREAVPPLWEPLHYLCFTRLPPGSRTNNAPAIARLLLDHGADPNAHFMAGDSRYTPLVGAIGEGEENRPPHPRRVELTRLLIERGAEPRDEQVGYNIHFRGDVAWLLVIARDREDRDFERWIGEHDGRRSSTEALDLHGAARRDRVDVVRRMLDSGVSPDLRDRHGATALHHAAYHDARGVAQLLIERGAQVDVFEPVHEATALWWALYGDRLEVVELLSRVSSDVWSLSFAGKIDRLRTVLRAEPALAKAGDPITPLMLLPPDDDLAFEIAQLFLSLGADPTITGADGRTAGERARLRGLDRAAAIL